MTFSPYFLISLEGFINIFIYLNNLSQEYVRHRNKGFKGLKVAIQPEQVSLNPFNPFFLPSGWHGDVAITRKLTGPSRRFFRCGANDPEKALVTLNWWGGRFGVVYMFNRVVIGEVFQ